MRLLFAVHSARVGGAQLSALGAAQWLSARHELHIAIRRGPLRGSFAAHGAVLRASPTMTFGWGSRRRWLLQAARSILDGLRIARYVRRHRIEAVYTNSTVLLGPVLGARLARVPAIVHARELPPDRRARALFATLGALADTVIARSDAIAATFADARRARVVRIYGGVAVPPATTRRRAFHSPPRVCLIGTINGDGRKGQDIAIDAIAGLAARGVRARLDLVGPIQQRASAAALRDRARALGVDDRVRLPGVSDRVGDVIAASDIVLSCARSEPLGLTVIEALARQTPVVAARVGGIPEIVRDGETGLLVEPEDAPAVAEAIARLLADPGGASEMGRRGRADMAARFDRERALRELEAELVRRAGR